MEAGSVQRADLQARTVTDFAEVAAVLVNPSLAPDAGAGQRFSGQTVSVTEFLGLSGRDHTKRRAAVSRWLAGPAVRRREPEIERVARELIVRLPVGETIELGATYARPLAARSALELLGLDPRHVDEVVALAQQVMDLNRSHRRRILASVKLYRLAEAEFARLGSDFHEDTTALMPALLRSASTADVYGVVMPLLTVGVELTARAVLSCIAYVNDDQPQGDRPSDAALDVAIAKGRILPTTDRLARCPTQIGRHRISEDDRVRVNLVDHDSDQGSRPLPFGLGSHYCLGASWTHSISRAAVVSLRAASPKIAIVSLTASAEPPGGPTAVMARLLP